MDRIPTFIISLDRESERFKNTVAQFPKHRDYFTVVPAVYGDKLPAKEYFNYILNSDHRLLITPAQVGASLSHMRALEMFLASGADRALILEDDATGSDTALEYIYKSALELRGEFFLHCGAFYFIKAYVKKNKNLPNGIYDLYLSRGFVCAQCYVVTRKTAETILKKQKKIMEPADEWLKLLKGSGISTYFTGAMWHVDLRKTSVRHSATESESVQVRQTSVIGISTSKISQAAYNFIWKPIDKVMCELHRFAIRISAYSKGYKRVYAYNLESVPGSIDIVKATEEELIRQNQREW